MALDAQRVMHQAVLLLAGYTLVEAMRQGILVWICREHVPPARGEWLDASLHLGGLLLYALVGAGLWWLALPPGWAPAAELLAWAALVRASLFDPVLGATRNYYSHREGRPAEPLLRVGTTARSDRALRWLAPRLGRTPEQLRLALWALSTTGALIWYGH